MIEIVKIIKTGKKPNQEQYTKMSCKQTKTEFEHHNYIYKTEQAVKEFTKSFEEAKQAG